MVSVDSQTVLVVSPQKGTHFKAYIAEYLQALADTGYCRILFLDLSHFHPDYWGKPVRNRVRALVYRNLLEDTISKICNQNSIKILKKLDKKLTNDTLTFF